MLDWFTTLPQWLTSYETLNAELLEAIDQRIIEKFSKQLEYISYVMMTGICIVRVVTFAGVLKADEDMTLRFKVIPALAFIFYYLSKRLQKLDTNPRYRALAYPVFVVITVEIVLVNKGLSQIIGIGLYYHMLSVIMKISQLNIVEKVVLFTL